MEITYRNKPEDLGPYLDYYLKKTQEGKQVGIQIFARHQYLLILFFIFLAALVRIVNPDAASMENFIKGLGLFIIIDFIYLAIARFNPQVYYGKNALMQVRKKWSQKYVQLFQRQKKVHISIERLEILTADSIHQFHWNMVDNVAIQPDYIFIYVGTTYFIPRRDFPTEENYQEFGKTLMEYWGSGKNKPISADLIPNSMNKNK